MNFSLLLHKEILDNYALDLCITQIFDQDRNNVYQGICKKDKQKYFIKLETTSSKKLWSEIYKLSKIINASTNISTSEFILTSNNKPLIYSKKLDKIIMLLKWENLKPISLQKDFLFVVMGIATFHSILINYSSKFLKTSNFYSDFMFGDIPKAQEKDRLKQIFDFYKIYSPDYFKLTKGIIHNDLNIKNIAKIGKKLFITDFEHIKSGPLISDIGVLMLDFWQDNDINSFKLKLKRFLKEYTKIVRLSEYDKKCIILFSIRYLYSDDNYFTYFYKKKGKYKKEIQKVRNRIEILSNKK